MTGVYDPWLVLLSIAVACLASYVALDLASRVTAASGTTAARTWLAWGAVSMGMGIWAMHFIGMLAFRLPIPLSYDPGTTLASLLIAVLVSGFALRTVSAGELGPRRLAGAGTLMGLGIAAMHYSGMAAMDLRPSIQYRPSMLVLSVAIAIAASAAALWLAFRLKAETLLTAFRRRVGSATVMGGAISGMHYTGMAAAIFAPDSICTVTPQNIDSVGLAGSIGAAAFAILATTIAISLLDERLAMRAARQAEKLRESEERYRVLWETTSDAVLLLDTESRILFANNAVRDVFGHAREDVIGRNIALLQPERLREAHRRGMAHYLASGVKTLDWRSTESFGLHKDGREFPVEVSFSRADAQGQVRFAGFMRDISERRFVAQLLAGQKEALQMIAAGRPVSETLGAIARLLEDAFPRTHATILLADGANERLYHGAAPSLSPEFVKAIDGFPIGPEHGVCGVAAWRKSAVVVPDISADPNCRSFHDLAARHGLAACWSHPILSTEGQLLGTFAMYSRDKRGPEARESEAARSAAALAAIAIERDRAEQRMHALNEDLERRVEERTASLTELNRELEAFSSSVSHDLRAPLRRISAFSGLLAARRESLDVEANRYASIISRETGRMIQLTDNLLKLSRLGLVPVRKVPIALGQVVEEARTGLSLEAGAKRVEWQIEPLPVVSVDPDLISAVFSNLLGNALKYSRGRDPAVIRVGVADLGNSDEISVFVQDNGVGFDMQYADKLFGVFERLHTEAEFEGTGIGLANVRRIVERHGGTVWAEGRPGAGATFYFSLPA